MEKLLNKAFGMVQKTVEKRGVTVETFAKEFTNTSYYTDGIEIHLRNGKVSVKLNNLTLRELTETEYQTMFNLLFNEDKTELAEVPLEKRDLPRLEEKTTVAVELEVEESTVKFGSMIVEEVQEDNEIIVGQTSVEGSLAQLSLF